MRHLRRSVFCLGMLCCLAQIQASDIQYRSSIGITKQIADEWKLAFNDGIRFRAGDHELFYVDSNVGLAYSGLAPWLDVSFDLKWSSQEDEDDGHWQQEIRPVWNATVKHEFLGVTLKDRSRIEYRERQVDRDVWRYRNELKAEMPFALTPLKLKPYFADEVWFRLDGTGFYKNRVTAGVTLPISERVTGNVYYYWDKVTDDGDVDWEEHNVIGFKLQVAF